MIIIFNNLPHIDFVIMIHHVILPKIVQIGPITRGTAKAKSKLDSFPWCNQWWRWIFEYNSDDAHKRKRLSNILILDPVQWSARPLVTLLLFYETHHESGGSWNQRWSQAHQRRAFYISANSPARADQTVCWNGEIGCLGVIQRDDGIKLFKNGWFSTGKITATTPVPSSLLQGFCSPPFPKQHPISWDHGGAMDAV